MAAPDTGGKRKMIIGAALLALFLGALDALVMSAAMPTIVGELGGLSLYAWVYSAYFLSRAVSLPVFGKLADLFAVKTLMMVAITLFVAASVAAGASPSMGFLVGARVFQGVGAGGIFALVYVVLTDVSRKGERGKTLSLASSIWGISSIIGPTLGGFMVTYFSWPWIFYINLPLGLLSLAGIGFFFRELREKPEQIAPDWAGIFYFCLAVLAALILIMTGGREIPWKSGPGIGLALLSMGAGTLFVRTELKAPDPFLDFSFFRYPGFALGNGVTFMASFSMFSLFAYAPLFLQGGLSQSPMVVGYAMLFLSLGWSVGGLLMGRVVDRVGGRRAALSGGLLMAAGAWLCLGFHLDTALWYCFFVFTLIGLGMGFVTLSTLLIVQDSVEPRDLGAATSFNQFARTLGGTVGVGVCGSVVFSRLFAGFDPGALSPEIAAQVRENLARIFSPEFRSAMDPGIGPKVLAILQETVVDGVWAAFAVVAAASILGLCLAFFLPGEKPQGPAG